MKSKLLKFLKWAGIGIGILALLFLGLYLWLNEKKPVGTEGPEAEILAERMARAINKPAWDSTTYIQWTFFGVHEFIWDKKRHFTQVRWDDYEVLLDINTIGGLAKKNGQALAGDEAQNTIQKAWEFWCNDSFWLNAPAKIFDAGVKRSIVDLDDGSQALMATYTSGGVTPGDSYLWILDENGLPTSVKMWVNIMPIGGTTFSWEKWITLPTGAQLSTYHDGGLLNIDISNLNAGNSIDALGLELDPFSVLAN